MRRRIKFVMSVASLTLAMLFMLFGVYAASTRQVAITGTITFTSDRVEATVSVYEVYGTGTINVAELTAVGSQTFAINENQNGKEINLSPALNDTQTKYTFIIKIQSGFPADSGSSIDVEIELPQLPSGTSGWLALNHTGSATAPTAPATGANAANTNIAGNGAYYYTFTYTATPASAPATASVGFNCSVTLKRVNAA